MSGRYDIVDDPLQEEGGAEGGGDKGGRACQDHRQLLLIIEQNLPEPGQDRGPAVAFLKGRGGGEGYYESAPLLFQVGRAHPVNLSVLGVHDRRRAVVKGIEDHIVQPSVLFPEVQDHRLDGFLQVRYVLFLGTQSRCVHPQPAAGVYDALQAGAVRACAACFPDAEQRQSQPVVCAYRGDACGGAVGIVMLSDFDLLLHGLPLQNVDRRLYLRILEAEAAPTAAERL